jgi:hypothetical protein
MTTFQLVHRFTRRSGFEEKAQPSGMIDASTVVFLADCPRRIRPVERRYLEGLALISNGFDSPGFPSARVWAPEGNVPILVAEPERGLLESVAALADANGHRLILNAPPAPVTPRVAARARLVDARREREEFHASSITAIDEEVARAARRFEERRAAAAQADAEREEGLLVASGVPMSHWPKHTAGYRRWRAHEDQVEAERQADQERQRALDRERRIAECRRSSSAARRRSVRSRPPSAR